MTHSDCAFANLSPFVFHFLILNYLPLTSVHVK